MRWVLNWNDIFPHYKCVLHFRKFSLGSSQNIGLELDSSKVCTNPSVYIVIEALIYSIMSLINAKFNIIDCFRYKTKGEFYI